MVLPLYDDNPTKGKPYVTWTLVGINVFLFLLDLLGAIKQGPYGFYGPLAGWMLVPAELTQGLQSPTNGLTGPPAAITVVTSMFLHGGVFHLLGNMLFLVIFGNNIEEVLGRVKYLLFYFLCGIAAALTQVMAQPGSTIPVLGASGAIAGVLGAYLILYPKSKVNTLIFLIIFIKKVPIPAWLLLGLWFFSQFFSQLTHARAGGPDQGGVAYLAHIGGFIAGMLLIKILGGRATPPEPKLRVIYPDEG